MKSKSFALILVAGLALLMAARIQGQTTTPPYLSQFPSPERIKADVSGVDAMETAAKQAGIFWQLHELISLLAYSQRRTDRQFTPDEQRLEVVYRNAHYTAIEPFEGKVTGADKPRWFELRGKYEMDLWLRDEVFKKYFTPDLRRAIYVALKGEIPTTNAPEGSRLTPPAVASTAAANPAKSTDSTGTAGRAETAPGGRLYSDAAGNWKYQDRWGGVYDKNGYTWADGSLTTNSGIQVKVDQPGVVDYGYGQKTNLEQLLGSAVTLQDARQHAINIEEDLQGMGQAQPGKAPNEQQRQVASSAPGAALPKLTQLADALKRVRDAVIKLNEERARSAYLQNPPAANPDSKNAETYLAEGIKYNDAKDYARAIEAFRKATALNPKMSEAYHRMAGAYFVLDRDQEALVAVKEAIRLNPNQPAHHFLLGTVLYKLAQFEQAVASLRRAVELKPDFALAHYYLGRTYLRLGRRQEAQAVYKVLKPLDPAKAQQLYAEINH